MTVSDEDNGYIFEELNLFPSLYVDEAGQTVEVPEPPPDQVCFNGDYARVFNRAHIAFFANYQRRSIRCEVPWTSLKARFGVEICSVDDAEAVYLANRHKLEELARALIEQGKVTADDRVVIE
jgi:hypothetical protein